MAETPINISDLSVSRLLRLHSNVSEELRVRGITRSANNPTGDLAEFLFCRAFGWKQAPNSERYIDAIGLDGLRYQIKGRRLHRRNKSRQLSAIRDFKSRNFDFLAGVLFGDDYSIYRAGLVPFHIVEARAKYVSHTNSHKFMLTDDVWDESDVKDVTNVLRSVQL